MSLLPLSLAIHPLDHLLYDEVREPRVLAQIGKLELVVLAAEGGRGRDDETDSALVDDVADDEVLHPDANGRLVEDQILRVEYGAEAHAVVEDVELAHQRQALVVEALVLADKH